MFFQFIFLRKKPNDMNRYVNSSVSLLKTVLAPAFCAILFSCSGLKDEDSLKGTLAIGFVEDSYRATKAMSASIPDTSDFILRVTDSKGKKIYEGLFGSAPQSLLLEPGSYTIDAFSGTFSTPSFDAPIYGDTQVAVVRSGEVSRVDLVCRQTNSGVKLSVSSDFLTSFPSSVLFLSSADGRLNYPYREKRIAYFRPGNVSLTINDGFSDKVLMTRVLEKSEILNISVSAPSASSSSSSNSSGISISVDTTRYWVNEDYVIGGESDRGGTPDQALSVSQARSNTGLNGVWVYGYVVGGDLTSSGADFTGPFTSRTNIAISSKRTASTRDACLSVQLPKGKIRDALNLVDNPDLLGAKVFIKGDIVEAYYGMPGVVDLTDFRL